MLIQSTTTSILILSNIKIIDTKHHTHQKTNTVLFVYRLESRYKIQCLSSASTTLNLSLAKVRYYAKLVVPNSILKLLSSNSTINRRFFDVINYKYCYDVHIYVMTIKKIQRSSEILVQIQSLTLSTSLIQ